MDWRPASPWRGPRHDLWPTGLYSGHFRLTCSCLACLLHQHLSTSHGPRACLSNYVPRAPVSLLWGCGSIPLIPLNQSVCL